MSVQPPKLNGSAGKKPKLDGKRTGATVAGTAQSAAQVNPAPKTATDLTADVVLLALRSRFNPLRGLTPQLLVAQLDNFHLGYVAYAAYTWDAMERRDDTLRNVVSKRKKAAAALRRESLQIEESDEAAEHAAALDEFYDNLTAVNALDENERGGLRTLLYQMMDAVGKYYAVHEIVWQPGGPDGTEPGMLTAELRFAPLWFFENRYGRLRFTRLPLGGAEGEELDLGGWMITKGDGLMEASSVARMFKELPLKDWLAYSDKFGTPGVLGMTDAAKGSDAGNAMAAAVAQFGQNWSGVVYGATGAIQEPLKLITPGAGAATLPFPPLIERMDRAMSALWRGSDLSTMSADNKGASVQEGETDLLLVDDAAMLTDTLNHYLDRWVIWQKFGTWNCKARSKIVVPEKINAELDLKIDDFLLKAGASLGEQERLEHYGRPNLDPKDTPLRNPATVTEKIQDTETAKTPNELSNARSGESAHHSNTPSLHHSTGEDAPSLGKLMANARGLFPLALAKDLQPLRKAIARVLHGEDAGLRARAHALYEAMPDLANEIIAAGESEESLYQILSAAAASGLANNEPTQ